MRTRKCWLWPTSVADPLVLPGGGVLLRVAAGAVGGDELAGDLLAVAAGAAGDLVRADVELPLRAGALDPRRRAGMLEGEPLTRQVAEVGDVDDRVLVF